MKIINLSLLRPESWLYPNQIKIGKPKAISCFNDWTFSLVRLLAFTGHEFECMIRI